MYHSFIIHLSADGLPCPGYCKQCRNEHWGTRVSFNSGFLGVYAQQWDCWVVWSAILLICHTQYYRINVYVLF